MEIKRYEIELTHKCLNVACAIRCTMYDEEDLDYIIKNVGLQSLAANEIYFYFQTEEAMNPKRNDYFGYLYDDKIRVKFPPRIFWKITAQYKGEAIWK